MPIEVRELHIKAVVQDADCNTSNNQNNNTSSAPSDNSTNSIVEQCVEQVLNILKEKRER